MRRTERLVLVEIQNRRTRPMTDVRRQFRDDYAHHTGCRRNLDRSNRHSERIHLPAQFW